MFLRTETSREMKIVGKRRMMSFAENSTGALFRSFMPRQNEITNRADQNILCVQNYPAGFYEKFNPNRPFEKWAAVEVKDFNSVPAEMETTIIPSGLYAVFLFKGTLANAGPFFENLFAKWLPSSGYQLDARPHFDVLGAKYRHDHPESEEEIWIPIIKQNTPSE